MTKKFIYDFANTKNDYSDFQFISSWETKLQVLDESQNEFSN